MHARMGPWGPNVHDSIHISILVADLSEETGRRLARALESDWPTGNPPRFSLGTHRTLHSGLIEDTDALIVDIGDCIPDEEAIFQIITLRDTGLPVIVLGERPVDAECFTGSDVLFLERNTPPATITGTLIGVSHRQTEIASLLQENGRTRQHVDRLDSQLDRLQVELEDASRLQQEYLPDPVQDLPGGCVSTLWKPAGLVSGDLVAVTRIDERRTGLLVADAIGHGIPAALLSMMMQRTLIELEQFEEGRLLSQPEKVLERLNQSLCRRQGATTRFATAACAIFDAADLTIQVSGAGHPAPLLVSKRGTSRKLPVHGPLLGIFENEIYEKTTIQLQHGDRVVFYSDGLEQATDAVTSLITEASRAPGAGEFITCVNEQLASTPGRRREDELNGIDDLTMLCLYVNECLAGTRAAA